MLLFGRGEWGNWDSAVVTSPIKVTEADNYHGNKKDLLKIYCIAGTLLSLSHVLFQLTLTTQWGRYWIFQYFTCDKTKVQRSTGTPSRPSSDLWDDAEISTNQRAQSPCSSWPKNRPLSKENSGFLIPNLLFLKFCSTYFTLKSERQSWLLFPWICHQPSPNDSKESISGFKCFNFFFHPLAWPFHSRIWNFGIYFCILPGIQKIPTKYLTKIHSTRRKVEKMRTYMLTSWDPITCLEMSTVMSVCEPT